MAVLLVLFLVQHLWIDSLIVGAVLVGFLVFLAMVGRYERNVRTKIDRMIEEDREQS